MNLAKDINLSVEYTIQGSNEWLTIKLEDKLNLMEVYLDYPVTPQNTPNQGYHFQEAIVIAMRRAVSLAVEQGMISVSPGQPLTSNTVSTKEPSSTTLSTDLELL